jgi:tetratricopeptide (TPR) repeat protein
MDAQLSVQPAELPQEVCFQLDAVEGWLMLANPGEASAEFDSIPEEHRDHPNVLAIQWRLCRATGNPEEAWHAAYKLCELVPHCAGAWICQADSLRELRGAQAAADLLLSVADRFPEEAVLSYNLACYLTQLGEWEPAWKSLRSAFDRDPENQLKVLAVQDPDLVPLWEKLGGSVTVVTIELRTSDTA